MSLFDAALILQQDPALRDRFIVILAPIDQKPAK